jgi:hypothetical protein
MVREVCANTCCVSKEAITAHESQAGLGLWACPDLPKRSAAALGKVDLHECQRSLTHAPSLVMAVGVPALCIARRVCTPASSSTSLEAMFGKSQTDHICAKSQNT